MQNIWTRIKQSPDWQFAGGAILGMTLLQAIGPEHFRFDNAWTSSGEIWRVVTAHWVHVGWLHWLFNIFSLLICISLTSPNWSIKRWLVTTISMAFGISILFTFFNPEIKWYVGFSGVLYGLFILGSISLYRRDRLIAVLVATAIMAKVLMEQFNFLDFNTADIIGARVEVDAHLYGLLMAIAIALVSTRYTMSHKRTGRSVT